MLIQSYKADELRFAYCYHVYYRFGTLCRRPYLPFASLDKTELQRIVDRFPIRIIESNSDPVSLLTLASLRPTETVSGCASKLKGQVSKWLREQLELDRPTDLLKSGYFACTSGPSTQVQLSDYLECQGEHHGLMDRLLPPVFVTEFSESDDMEGRLGTKHAATVIKFHLVLATWRRHGVFVREAGEAVASRWQELQIDNRFALCKVSFVPDHVHVTLRTHPANAPSDLVVILMNAAQEVMYEQFEDNLIRGRVEKLWQPSAYVGSFGDLTTPMMQSYVKNWLQND
jgi:REP element-mobilizing transposase RayT